jgi:hypothetical protein
MNKWLQQFSAWPKWSCIAHLLLFGCYPAFSQTLSITRSNGAAVISIDDTNRMYYLEAKTNASGPFTLTGHVIGGTWKPAVVPTTLPMRYMRARSLNGFVIYAEPFADAGGNAGDCTGTYIGQALYTTESIGWYTNGSPTLRVAAASNGGDNIRIVASSLSGSFACGPSPLTITPDEGPFVFTVYFRTNLPSAPYALLIEGFLQEQ